VLAGLNLAAGCRRDGGGGGAGGWRRRRAGGGGAGGVVDMRSTGDGRERVGRSSRFRARCRCSSSYAVMCTLRWPTGSASPPAESSLERAAPAGEGGLALPLQSGRAEESRGGRKRECARRDGTSGSVGGMRGAWVAVKREASRGCESSGGRLHFAARHAAAAGVPTL
jgi:hypothetical protein